MYVLLRSHPQRWLFLYSFEYFHTILKFCTEVKTLLTLHAVLCVFFTQNDFKLLESLDYMMFFAQHVFSVFKFSR